jgi:hypothetical protein
MGLTIHYQLAAPADCDAARAHELVRQMRRRAQHFKQRGRVDRVLPIGSDHEALRWAIAFRSVPHPVQANTFSGIEIPAEAGILFFVEVGAECEPMALGLCRYPVPALLGPAKQTVGSSLREICQGAAKMRSVCKKSSASISHGRKPDRRHHWCWDSTTNGFCWCR